MSEATDNKLIAKAIASLAESQEKLAASQELLASRKKVSMGDYLRKRKGGPKLAFRAVRQNGREAQQLTHDEIRALNEIKRPGLYLDKRFDVKIAESNAGKELDINYPNSTIDQRMENAQFFSGGGFKGLVQKIVAEQDAMLATA